jgi:hypothetical protein
MSETPLNKLKNGALNCASAVLLRVDLVAEQSRLKSKFESLGERLLRSLQEGSLDTLKEDPAVVELVGAIEENKARIRELEKRCQKGFFSCSEKD